jgi:hypothetical protein
MAVSSLIVQGTLGSSQLVTIQPASGTVYTFKRGKIVRYGSGGTNFFVGASGYAFEEFVYYSFSEAGVTSRVGSTTTNSSGSNYFSAVSNDATSFIQTDSNFGWDLRYVLVGVSMT